MYFNSSCWFISPVIISRYRREYTKIIDKNTCYSNHPSSNPPFCTDFGSTERRQSTGKLPSCRLYLRRGLTFFIEQYERKQEKIRSKPNLSIKYDPQTSQDTYTPEATIYFEPTHTIQEFTQRKYLKIAVENNGGGVAERCKATLRVLKYDPADTRHPSEDPKPLLWETEEITQDIAINGFEMVYVVLSDTRLSTDIHKQMLGENYHALVATPPTVRVQNNPYTIRAQDAFGKGDFDIEIAVNPKSGEVIQAIFRVHVTDNWHNISMERIS